MASYWLNIVNSKILGIGEDQIMRNIFKSKKGISPILATLLLIVIAVAAVIVTYAWVMTFTSSTTDQAGAILTVENVRFYDDSGEKVDITLRNSGTSSAKIVEVYEGTSSSNLDTVDTESYSPSAVVSEGTSTKITFDLEWESGTRYHFKVVTEEGLSIPFSEEA
jgi:flagellin-like protein